jgi:hypothetical protein
LAFDFHNPGDGTMTLRVDGVDVVTTATDQDTQYQAGNQLQLSSTTFDVVEGSGSGLDADLLDGLDSTDFVAATTDLWVNETGDTMIGTLALDPASGFALQIGAGHSINLGGDVYLGGTLFLHAQDTDNTGAGLGALDAITTGDSNTALGREALGATTTGSLNTAVGARALDVNSTGRNNTAVGMGALGSNQGGSYNTALGTLALNVNTGSSNTAVGASVLDSNTSGGSNTAVGEYALSSNVTGSFNAAFGRNALFANTASGNTAFGAFALKSNTTGSDNTAVGYNALDANLTGSRNTAVGDSALGANTANDNTAVGESALLSNTSGTGNTAVGRFALDSNSTGSSNIALGTNAGGDITGSNNIAIGSSGALGESFTIRIGEDGLHASTFIAGIHGNQVNSPAIEVFVDTEGELGTMVSSRRFKEQIAEIGSMSERLLALRPVSFRYRAEVTGSESGGERSLEFGLIAEEVAEVFPELVVYDEEGAPYTVRYHLLVPLLLAERQREHREIEALRDEIAELRRVLGRGGR